MKMRRLICLVLGVLMALALFGGCSKDIGRQNDPPEEPSPSPSEELPPEEDAEPTPPVEDEPPSGLYARIEENETIKSYTADDGTEVLRLYISLPRLSGAGMDYSSINQHYENQAEVHIVFAEGELLSIANNIYKDCLEGDRPFYPYESEQTYRTAYNEDGYACFLREYAEYSGNQLSSYSISAECFRLEDGIQLYADDLFSVGEAEYAAFIQSKVIEQIEADPEGYFEGYRELAVSRYQKECWYLTDGGLRVFYQPKDLSQEMNEFLIPFDDFGEMFVLW